MFDLRDDELITLLDADAGSTPFPPACDRRTWNRMPAVPWRSAHAGRLVDEAIELAASSTPVLLASDYLEHARTGNRYGYESRYFERRTRLATLASRRHRRVSQGRPDTGADPVVTVECVPTTGDPFMTQAFGGRLQRVTVQVTGTGHRLTVTHDLEPDPDRETT